MAAGRQQPAEAVPGRRGSGNGIKRREKEPVESKTAQKACYKLPTGLLPAHPQIEHQPCKPLNRPWQNAMPDTHLERLKGIDLSVVSIDQVKEYIGVLLKGRPTAAPVNYWLDTTAKNSTKRCGRCRLRRLQKNTACSGTCVAFSRAAQC